MTTVDRGWIASKIEKNFIPGPWCHRKSSFSELVLIWGWKSDVRKEDRVAREVKGRTESRRGRPWWEGQRIEPAVCGLKPF